MATASTSSRYWQPTTTSTPTFPPLIDHAMIDNDGASTEEEEVTFASAEIKALSALRTSPTYTEPCRGADIGQSMQLRLKKTPPTYHPEYEARRLIDYFQSYVQTWEQGGTGLAVINPYAKGVYDAIPPFDFVWTDNYLIDPR